MSQEDHSLEGVTSYRRRYCLHQVSLTKTQCVYPRDVEYISFFNKLLCKDNIFFFFFASETLLASGLVPGSLLPPVDQKNNVVPTALLRGATRTRSVDPIPDLNVDEV